jgi:hypothetical protein
MSQPCLDAALAAFRALLDELGLFDAEIVVRVDGRVTIQLHDDRYFTKHRLHADLNKDSSVLPPDAVMHGAFAEWKPPT